MEAGKRMNISYLVKMLCREFAIYYRLAITTNNITPMINSQVIDRFALAQVMCTN